MDFLTAILLLVVLSGVLLLIMLSYKLSGERPIFFKSLRSGKNIAPFWMLKFRTLSPDEKKSLQKRRFPLGDFLRKTNMDELPQLWNVVRGEMSLVGPRPLPVEYVNLFSAEQNKRHEVLPGITGLAQISGKNNLPWPEKFKFDLEYIDRCSLWLDLTILFKTFLLALSFKQDTSLNEEKFTG